VISFLHPTLPKALFTLIASLIFSQLIPAIGLQEVPVTQPLLSGQVYISNPGDDSVIYRLRPLYWLPSFFIFRNSHAVSDLGQIIPYSLIYWIFISYIISCVYFETRDMVKSRLDKMANYTISDHFSG
jgi:hypothetical protein